MLETRVLPLALASLLLLAGTHALPLSSLLAFAAVVWASVRYQGQGRLREHLGWLLAGVLAGAAPFALRLFAGPDASAEWMTTCVAIAVVAAIGITIQSVRYLPPRRALSAPLT